MQIEYDWRQVENDIVLLDTTTRALTLTGWQIQSMAPYWENGKSMVLILFWRVKP